MDIANESTGAAARRILVIDVGGTHIKVKCSTSAEARRAASGTGMTAALMVSIVKELVHDWEFDVVSIGYPGAVLHGTIAREPYNLGSGWMGFDFEEAFGKPVRMINDAAMQALGGYDGGHMLFLGIGTGLGSALILNGELQALELGHLPYRKGRTYEEFAGLKGQKWLGRKRWRRAVTRVIEDLTAALRTTS